MATSFETNILTKILKLVILLFLAKINATFSLLKEVKSTCGKQPKVDNKKILDFIHTIMVLCSSRKKGGYDSQKTEEAIFEQKLGSPVQIRPDKPVDY